jgi:hypothetical protein
MDHIALSLNITPLADCQLAALREVIDLQEHSVKDTSPFNADWFNLIRRENGKNSALINKWNGSEQQKEFLRRTLKGRNISWGDQITKAKSHGPYQIDLDGVCYNILSINKFAKEHNLNAASLRFSLWNGTRTKTKGKLVQVVKI